MQEHSPDSKESGELLSGLGSANFVSADAGSDSDSLSKGHNSAGVTPADFRAANPDLPFRLSGSQKKTAFALRKNCERMVAESGIGRVVFATFTIGARSEETGFWDKVHDGAEASRLWDNLRRRFIGEFFEKLIVVTERHKDGGIHFHALCVLLPEFGEVREGFDFEAVARGDYSSVPEALRFVWRRFREELPAFGFGRAEVMPIRKTGEAVASYVAKYVEKNLFNRHAGDAGKRLVRYVGWKRLQMKPNEFSFCSPGAIAWRANAARLASLVGVRDRSEVADAFGPRWAYRLSRVMAATAGDVLAVPWADFSRRTARDCFPERERVRAIVMRQARQRWMARRRIADGARPGLWCWHFRPLRERLQRNFDFPKTARPARTIPGI